MKLDLSTFKSSRAQTPTRFSIHIFANISANIFSGIVLGTLFCFSAFAKPLHHRGCIEVPYKGKMPSGRYLYPNAQDNMPTDEPYSENNKGNREGSKDKNSGKPSTTEQRLHLHPLSIGYSGYPISTLFLQILETVDEENTHDKMMISQQIIDDQLDQAAVNMDLEGAMIALRLGANINHFGKTGYTPLMYAAARNNPEFIAKMIELGARVDLISPLLGKDAYLIAREAGAQDSLKLIQEYLPTPSDSFELEYALSHGDINGVLRELKTDETPLMYAARRNIPWLIVGLLRKGADASFVSPVTGKTALQVAEENCSVEAYELLRDELDSPFLNRSKQKAK